MSLQRARETLEVMLGHLGLVFEVEELEPAGRHVLNIRSRESGRLIGRDGQVLEDLQFLLNRILNRSEEGAASVIVARSRTSSAASARWPTRSGAPASRWCCRP
jgi:spoIIIJ-associated protein